MKEDMNITLTIDYILRYFHRSYPSTAQSSPKDVEVTHKNFLHAGTADVPSASIASQTRRERSFHDFSTVLIGAHFWLLTTIHARTSNDDPRLSRLAPTD